MSILKEIKPTSLEEFKKSASLDAGNAGYLEDLYEQYLKDPAQLSLEWRHYFGVLQSVSAREESHQEIRETFKQIVRQAPVFRSQQMNSNSADAVMLEKQLLQEKKQTRVRELIDAYRLLGHLNAAIDPLMNRVKRPVPELMLSYYHLSESDLNTEFEVGSLPGARVRTLSNILEDLNKIYCGSIASEFMHIPDSPERLWVQSQVEQSSNEAALPLATKQRLLKSITAAEGLEKYLGAKYPGAKRFSLEGNDTLLVALDTLVQEGGIKGLKEIVIGMAHRGRLNVLVNLLGKAPSQLFDEFEGKHYSESLESGDVKYHQGFSSNIDTPGGHVHLSLAFNPSHLEIVSPVVCGSVKARQERRSDRDFSEVLSIGIHGDAAFAGQGVVMETLNMSETRGFKIGGSIHIIVNNQIGFTTSDPHEARSTLYCSDIGKMIEVPVFHINANDPEAVYRVMKLALRYREKFKKDVIIDLIGYRRHGHNEADEPAATQPIMYQQIRKLPTVCALYADRLLQEQSMTSLEIEKFSQDYRNSLEKREGLVAQDIVNGVQYEFASDWELYATKDWRVAAKTGVHKVLLKKLAELQTTLPEGFVLHPRIEKIIQDRRKMTAGELPLDWGYAETLAYATIINDNFLVRLSGQDVGRGTFFHRHAVLYNQKDGSEYIPLAQLSKGQATFTVVDSLLSEEAVLGFEYGFSSTEPKGITLWEAQFGDFANNAQVVIDQFISSGEQKWGRLSGLTLLLPHGFEGQGPEHSSARLERYLQLCAEHNIQVCVPTTPAQIFHLLRRQVIRPMRKPLIVITPKSLLRHKLAVSSLQDLELDQYLPVIVEIDALAAEQVSRVIFCSGKVYYELLEKRRSSQISTVAIIRLEQLYPFPDKEIKEVLSHYKNLKTAVWCQEEPKNQGAWTFIQDYLNECLEQNAKIQYVGRQAAAAPAVGYLHLHQEQQNSLVNDALNEGSKA